jgi:radical SAM-linked protein
LQTLPIDAHLPWEHIDVGLEDGFLAREYRKSLQSRLSPPCGKPKGMFVHHDNAQSAKADERRLVCYDCGIACDMSKMGRRRVDLLQTMGAHEPGVKARLPVAPEPQQPTRKGPERYRPPRPEGDVERWRLRYAKTGAAALLGHLDLIRELPRAIRRAGVTMVYTEGFHPKPDMSFGPALSLGVASIDEYIDVRLIEAPSPAELVERLRQAEAGGIHFLGAARLSDHDPAVGRVVGGAEYLIALARKSVEQAGGESWLQGKVDAFMQLESAIVLRNVKGIKRRVDVRKHVLALEPSGDAQHALQSAGIVGDVICLSATLEAGSQGSAKLTELLEAVFGDSAFPHVAVRTRLLANGASPLDLSAVRTGGKEASAAPTLSVSA